MQKRAVQLVHLLLFSFHSCMAPNTAEVVINSEPPGARIYEHNTFLGSTPVRLQLGAIPPAAHDAGTWCTGRTINAYLAGYTDGHDEIRLQLKDAAGRPIPRGHVMPLISDETIGRYTWNLLFRLQPIARVTHAPTTVQQQQQQSILVQGSTPIAPETGSLTITCNEQDAEVSIDRVFSGNTPALLKLSAGIHIVEVFKTGYATYKREIRITAGSEMPLRVTLTQQ